MQNRECYKETKHHLHRSVDTTGSSLFYFKDSKLSDEFLAMDIGYVVITWAD